MITNSSKEFNQTAQLLRLHKIALSIESLVKSKVNAKIAQLVEHNLAKVRVAGSSPVFRSKHYKTPKRHFFLAFFIEMNSVKLSCNISKNIVLLRRSEKINKSLFITL